MRFRLAELFISITATRKYRQTNAKRIDVPSITVLNCLLTWADLGAIEARCRFMPIYRHKIMSSPIFTPKMNEAHKYKNMNE